MLTRTRRLAVLAATGVWISLFHANGAAHADANCDTGGSVYTKGSSITCSAGASGSAAGAASGALPGTPSTSGGGGGSAPVVDPCTYTQIDVANSLLNAARVTSETNETTLTTGVWYEQDCPDGGMNMVSWTAPPGAAAPAPALPSPQVLAEQAATSVTVTTPEVNLDPFYLLEDGRRATLKNAQTWFWMNPAQWVPLTPRVDVGPVWVQATITPQTILFNINDGVTDTVTCTGPGTPIPAGTPGSSRPESTLRKAVGRTAELLMSRDRRLSTGRLRVRRQRVISTG